jgi:RNA polymerase sigma-70 factor (ECF subfamily)
MIDHVRKKGTRDKHITVSAKAVDSYAAPDSVTTPIQTTFAELSKLSENQQQALELRFNQGLTFAEIAERMQTTSDNTRQIISRAIRKLRTLMAGKEMK